MSTIEDRKKALEDLIVECRENGKEAMENGEVQRALSFQSAQRQYEDDLANVNRL